MPSDPRSRPRHRAGGRLAGRGDRARARGVRQLRARRVADAAQGLPAQSPPNGDFRAMPVRGEGLAVLKWITSFPGNPRRGLPTVTGIVLVSDADNGRAGRDARRARGDRAAHRRRGGGRDPGARPRGRRDGRPGRLRAARHVGRALHGRGRVRPGRLLRPRPGGRRRGGGRARLGGGRPRRGARSATSSAPSPRGTSR